MNADSLAQSPHAREFLEAIRPMLPAYRHRVLSFVATVHKGETVILRASLRLSVEAPCEIRPALKTSSLCAGQVQVTGSAEDPEFSVLQVLSGDRLPMAGEHPLKLVPESLRGYSAYYERPLPSRARATRRVDRLVLSGMGRWQLLSVGERELQRELHEIAFDALDELMRE